MSDKSMLSFRSEAREAANAAASDYLHGVRSRCEFRIETARRVLREKANNATLAEIREAESDLSKATEELTKVKLELQEYE